MYQKMLEALREKPMPYAAGEGNIWTDEYISTQMLKTHFSQDTDAASRRLCFMKKSADWIAEVAGGAVEKALLDLGCGPGLYAELFDDLGFAVTGVDFSIRSIEHARNSALGKGKAIRYACQDYRAIDFCAKFDVATLIYCDFGVMRPEDRAVVLGNIHRALKPGGLLILDVWTMNQYKGFAEKQSVAYEDGGFWRAGPYVCIERDFCYDPEATYLEQYLVITQGDCTCYNVWNCAFSEQSLKGELNAAGFAGIELYGDVGGEPFGETGNTICAVARKR